MAPVLLAAVVAVLLLELILHIARPSAAAGFASEPTSLVTESAPESPWEGPAPRPSEAPLLDDAPPTEECREGFFLLFPAKGGGTACAANPASSRDHLGLPDASWFQETGGIPEVRHGDPVDDGLCACLNALPAFSFDASTSSGPPVKQVLHRATRLPITKWVCGDRCRNKPEDAKLDVEEAVDAGQETGKKAEDWLREWLPGWRWVFATQQTVLWIYLGLAGLMGVRGWLSLRLWRLPGDERARFLASSHVLSEFTVNLPIVLGVVGTLIAIAYAVQDKFQAGASVFVETFSGSFHIAVTTTICGGLVHACCFLLSAMDHWITGAAES